MTGRTKAKGARKPVSIAVKRQRFLVLLRDTGNVSRAAREAKVGVSTVYAYRARSAAFAVAWDAAVAEAMDELEELLMQRAKHGVERPVFHGGKLVGSMRTYSDALAMFMLRAKRPETYSRLAEAAPAIGVAGLSQDAARVEVQRRIERLTVPRLPAPGADGAPEDDA